MEMIWSNGNTPPLLVGVDTCIVTLEVNVSVSQEIGNQPVSRPDCSALGHILKGCSIIPQEHLFHYVHTRYILKARTWKKSRCHSIEE